MKPSCWIFGLFLFLPLSLFSQPGVQWIDDGPIHEAFLTNTSSAPILTAVPSQPPANLLERIPEQRDPQSQWIPGYWQWSENYQDFVWTTGVWRRPPPGHQWISGHWNKYPEGWVWIPGFWSSLAPSQFSFIQTPPPDPVDEDVGFPPSQNYFWVSGYWHYLTGQNRYEWLEGFWAEYDPNWVYVPAHYVWQKEGYLLIPGYWDWPFDNLGSLYKDAYIENFVEGIIIEPVLIDGWYITILYPWYPDYICYFWHHFHFFPVFWEEFCCVPPWWYWDPWWGFTWEDQWALWWWWCHPDFVQPVWINAALADLIPPPPFSLFDLIMQLLGPMVVTENGIVSVSDLLNALAQLSGSNLPIVPVKLEDQLKQKLSDSLKKPDTILKPGGKMPLPKQVPKPNTQPDKPKPPSAKQPPLPSKPNITDRRPRPPIRPYQPGRPQTRPEQPPSYPPTRPPQIDRRPPSFQPQSTQPPEIDRRPPTQRQPRRPWYRPWQRRPQRQPETQPPQTYPPSETYPPTDRRPPQTYPPSDRRPPQTYPPSDRQTPQTYPPSEMDTRPNNYPQIEIERYPQIDIQPRQDFPRFRPQEDQKYPPSEVQPRENQQRDQPF